MPTVERNFEERALRDLISGAYVLPAILVAHELRLFPLLAGQPRDVAEICAALHLEHRPAEALLAVCAAAGLVHRQDGRYALRQLAEDFFLPESPAYFGGYWDLMIENSKLYSFESLRQAILTDTPQAGDGAGEPGSKAHQLRSVTGAMHSRGGAAAALWPGLVDLSAHSVFLDIGGGSGVHSIGVVRRWPHLRAVVFDLAPVCELAAAQIAQRGLAGRVRTEAGDFLDPAPFPSADVHFYSEVLHNRSPQQCARLLAKSFQELPAGGRILLHEMLFDEELSGPLPVAAASLNMLLWTREGRQYSRPELSRMLSEAGFVGAQVFPASGYFSLLSASKPGPVPAAHSQAASA